MMLVYWLVIEINVTERNIFIKRQKDHHRIE